MTSPKIYDTVAFLPRRGVSQPVPPNQGANQMPDRNKPVQVPTTLRAYIKGVLRTFSFVPKARPKRKEKNITS